MRTFKQFLNEKADTAYELFFKKKLKMAGYDSPADIPNDKKDDFFNAVDKEWKADDEEK
jgi:hypothetical protein